MPVPQAIITGVFQVVVLLARTAFRGRSLVRKIDILSAEQYVIKIVRRATVGSDGAISQMVYFYLKGKLQGVWHVVVRAGKVIHSDLKK